MSDACDHIPHHAHPISRVVLCVLATSALDTPYKSCDNGVKANEEAPDDPTRTTHHFGFCRAWRVPGQQRMDTQARQPPRGETQLWLTPFAPASSARP